MRTWKFHLSNQFQKMIGVTLFRFKNLKHISIEFWVMCEIRVVIPVIMKIDRSQSYISPWFGVLIMSQTTRFRSSTRLFQSTHCFAAFAAVWIMSNLKINYFFRIHFQLNNCFILNCSFFFHYWLTYWYQKYKKALA